MKRVRVFCTLLSVLAPLALAPCATAAEWPEWLEGWLYNSHERTARGIAALESGNADAALAPLDTARRLEPGDPRSGLNAGTARLAAKRPDAAPVLETAAQTASRQSSHDVAALANYNLGNARLAAHDAGGAVEAYKQALRERPGFQEAKFNLELALRQQQQQQDQQKKDQDQKKKDQQKQDQKQQDEQKQDQQKQDQQKQDQQKQDQQKQDQQQDQQKQDQEKQQEQQQKQDQQQQKQGQEPQQKPPDNPEQRLPQFQDQPDMSAEEAAAILEAVENLEREQRRQEALEAAKTNVRRKKDW